MIDNTTRVPAAEPRLPSPAEEAEIDLIFGIGEFDDAVAALNMGLSAAERILRSGVEPAAGLRSALILLRGATNSLTERATKLEQAGSALLRAKTTA